MIHFENLDPPVLAVVLGDTDKDVHSNEIVTLAVELILDLEVEVFNALLVVVAVRIRTRLADIRALLLETVGARDEGGNLGDKVVGVVNLDIDEEIDVLILLVELDGEVTEGLVVELDGAVDGRLELLLGVAVEVAVPVPARLSGELTEAAGPLAGAEALEEGSDAFVVDVTAGVRVVVVVLPGTAAAVLMLVGVLEAVLVSMLMLVAVLMVAVVAVVVVVTVVTMVVLVVMMAMVVVRMLVALLLGLAPKPPKC